MVNRLRKKLKDLIESFKNHLQQISSEYREIVQRRYFTVTGKNPDEKTVDLLISTGHLLFQTLFEFSVEIFRRFRWEYSKGFMYCLAWILLVFLGFLLGFLGDFIGNFERDLCVLFGLDFCCFFFFGFLLVLKEIFIGGVVDAGDQIMGFTVAKVPLQIEF